MIVFGVPTKVVKDYKGSMADDENGPVICAIKTLRKNFPQLLVCADVCMCAYTGEYPFLLSKITVNLNNETIFNHYVIFKLKFHFLKLF